MSEQTTPQAATPQAAPPVPQAPEKVHERVDSVETRAAALMEQIRAEQRDESANDSGDEGDGDEPHPPSPAAPSKAPPAKEKGEEEQAAKDPEKERRARIERAAELERQNQKLSTKLSEREARAAQREQQIEAREREVQALKAQVEKQFKVFESPDALLEVLAEKVPAERLSSWILDAQRPEKRAEWAAKRAAQEAAEKASPETTELKKRLEAMEAELQAARAHTTRAQAESQFAAKVKELSPNAPHVAALFEKRPGQLMQMAHQVADELARQEGSTSFERVVEFIESELSDYASVFAPQSGGEMSSGQVTTQAPVAKARTLTSRTSAGRSTLLDDEDASKLSLDERAEQLKRLARTAR